MTAARASWIIHRGNVPKGMFILHRCDNESCVNPEHLYLGDHGDNMVDIRALRFCVKDLELMEELIIISEYTPKNMEPTKTSICVMFRVSPMTLWKIRKSRLWPCRDGVHQFNWML